MMEVVIIVIMMMIVVMMIIVLVVMIMMMMMMLMIIALMTCVCVLCIWVFSALSFIHSDHFYSASSNPLLLRSAPDTARILCRSFTPKRHSNCELRTCPRSLCDG